MDSRGWRFCFIGGVALQRWGENRITRDIDLTLLTGFGGERVYIEELLSCFRGRRPDALDFALAYRVLLLQSEDGIGIDISLGGMPYEEEFVARASFFEFLPACKLRTCAAEDLVVLKAFAARPQDWVDIRGIVVRQGKLLDRQAISARLEPLVVLKEEPEILAQLEAIFRED